MLLPPHPGVAMLSSVAWQSTAMAYGVTFIERRVAPLYLTGDASGQARSARFLVHYRAQSWVRQLCFSESHASGLTLLGEAPTWLKCHDPAVFLSETVTRTSYKYRIFKSSTEIKSY